jgi:hypothetical protein
MLRNGANWYLSYEFGWSPLVNDLMDCLDVVDLTNKRVEEIQNLVRKNGSSRRVRLENHHNTVGPTPVYLDTANGVIFDGFLTRTSTRRTWGTQRWIPSNQEDFSIFPKATADLLKKAR